MTSSNGVQVDDKQARIILSGIIADSGDLSRPMAVISHKLVNSVHENFRAGGRYSSEGSILGGSSKWAKVKAPPTYKRGNKAAGIKAGDEKGSVLMRSAHLMNSIMPESSATEALTATNKEYAAIQNFGGKTKAHEIKPRDKKALAFGGIVRRSVHHPGSTLPARPFMVIQEQDIQDAETVLVAHVLRRAAT